MTMLDHGTGNLLLDNTVLPWEPVEVPPIKTGRFGSWEVVEETPPIIRGYFRGLQLCRQKNYVLKKDGVVYMSLTPMELESMRPHVAGATGRVVVVGGGLGVYLYNVMKKPEVTEVTLIEKEQDNVDFLASMGLWDWPGAEKLRVVVCDPVFKLDVEHPHIIPILRPDFLYVDIWSELASERALPETMIIQAQIDAKKVAFWTMELEFISWLQDNGRAPYPTRRDWIDFCESHGVPLHGYHGVEKWSVVAAKQVIMY